MWDWRQLRWLNLWGWWPHFERNPRKRLFFKYYGYFMFGMDCMTMILEFISLYIAIQKGSFRGAIVNIVTTTLGTVAWQKILTTLIYHEFITSVYTKLEDLNNRAIYLMGEDSQVNMSHREWRSKFTFIFVGSSMFTVAHYNIRPILIYYLYGETSIAMDMWIPWDVETSTTGWLIVLFHEFIHILSAMYGMVIFDSFFLTVFEMILAEFDVLKIALRKIDFAAKKKDVDINFCIQFHQELMILISKLDKFLTPFATIQTVMLTLTICFAGFEMVSLSEVSLNKMANLGEVVIASTYISFGYCYQCHCITEQCTELVTAACDNNWYEGTVEDQKSLLIFLERAKSPIIFGSIIQFDLGCFISIFKTAFSYYQVLQAFDIK